MRTFKSESIKPPRVHAAIELPDMPIDLEIGCGVGLHPIKYSKQNPNRFLIAIEKTQNKFEKFDRRIKNHPEIKNLQPIHANAIAWVTHFLKPKSISKCFILYPNPNSKNQAQRWIRMPFMQKLIEVLKPDGEIIFRTNEKSYNDEILVFAKSLWGLRCQVERIVGHAEVPLTHFEKKYLLRGDLCYEAIFHKGESSEAVAPIPPLHRRHTSSNR